MNHTNKKRSPKGGSKPYQKKQQKDNTNKETQRTDQKNRIYTTQTHRYYIQARQHI